MKSITQEQRKRIDALKDNPEELERCMDPLYFHNKYVKDPDLPDRTREQFEKWRKEVIDFRMMAGVNNTRYKAMSKRKYPVKLNELLR